MTCKGKCCCSILEMKKLRLMKVELLSAWSAFMNCLYGGKARWVPKEDCSYPTVLTLCGRTLLLLSVSTARSRTDYMIAWPMQSGSVGPLFKIIKNFKSVTAELNQAQGPSQCEAPCDYTELIFTSWPWQEVVLVAQSCPTLCNPMDCSLQGSSINNKERVD